MFTVMNERKERILDKLECGLPAPREELAVARAIKSGLRLQTNVPIFGLGGNTCLTEDVKKYSELLIDCDIWKIHIADQTTMLMKSLYEWIELGWVFTQMDTVYITSWDNEMTKTPVIVLERDPY